MTTPVDEYKFISSYCFNRLCFGCRLNPRSTPCFLSRIRMRVNECAELTGKSCGGRSSYETFKYLCDYCICTPCRSCKLLTTDSRCRLRNLNTLIHTCYVKVGGN